MAKIRVQTSFGDYRWTKFTLEPSPRFEKREFDTSRLDKKLCGGKFVKRFKENVGRYDRKYRNMIRAISKISGVLTIYPEDAVVQIWTPTDYIYEAFKNRILKILCREVFGKKVQDVQIVEQGV